MAGARVARTKRELEAGEYRSYLVIAGRVLVVLNRGKLSDAAARQRAAIGEGQDCGWWCEQALVGGPLAVRRALARLRPGRDAQLAHAIVATWDATNGAALDTEALREARTIAALGGLDDALSSALRVSLPASLHADLRAMRDRVRREVRARRSPPVPDVKGGPLDESRRYERIPGGGLTVNLEAICAWSKYRHRESLSRRVSALGAPLPRKPSLRSPLAPPPGDRNALLGMWRELGASRDEAEALVRHVKGLRLPLAG